VYGRGHGMTLLGKACREDHEKHDDRGRSVNKRTYVVVRTQ
jgi:hypothetical protein